MSDRITRVLHHVHTLDHGGIETFLMYMLKNYDRDRYQMDIVYSGPHEGAYANQARDLGAEILSCPMAYDQIRFVVQLIKLLKEGQYDAFNTHLDDFGAGALVAAKVAGVSARICSYHSNHVMRPFLKSIYQYTMRCIAKKVATKITTSSPDVTESHFGKKGLINPKIQSITYGCDTRYFGDENVEPLCLDQYGFTKENIVIGHVGHYSWQKNHRGLLEIASRVIDKIPQIRFLLCANGGSLRDEIECEIDRLGLRSYIVQVERLEDIRQFYASIDLFILPSVHEGMPVCIIEAQASGVPVVASKLGGVVVATCPQQQGNLFESNDIEGFVQCICNLLFDRKEMKEVGEAGKLFSKENLDIKYAIGQYQALYLNQ